MEEEKMLVPSRLKTVDGKDIMCYTGAFYLKNEEKIKRIIKKLFWNKSNHTRFYRDKRRINRRDFCCKWNAVTWHRQAAPGFLKREKNKTVFKRVPEKYTSNSFLSKRRISNPMRRVRWSNGWKRLWNGVETRVDIAVSATCSTSTNKQKILTNRKFW